MWDYKVQIVPIQELFQLLIFLRADRRIFIIMNGKYLLDFLVFKFKSADVVLFALRQIICTDETKFSSYFKYLFAYKFL